LALTCLPSKFAPKGSVDEQMEDHKIRPDRPGPNGALSLDETEEFESTFMTATEIQAAIGQGQFSQAMDSASFYMGIETLAHRTQVCS
jgi:hypothetical protein